MTHFSRKRLSELSQLFLKLGVIGFGGPAAHIAMMEDEVVNRRQWLTRSHFLDLIGATNLIPGPNSTEMAIHIGYIYGGVAGLFVAGICFILPAVLITGIFAWVYVTWGSLPQFTPLLYGIKPAVLAIILGALWRLGKKAVKTRQLFLIAIAVAVLVLVGVNEILALLLGGILGMISLSFFSQHPPSVLIITGLGAVFQGANLNMSVIATPTLVKLGLFFLKVGSVLFGSGYVLIAFLEKGLVNDYGWLTQQQLLDAVAIGQFTPGPVLSTATFIGYLILGIPGAIVATVGIFLPSFFFVAISNPFIPKLRQSKLASAFLDAVNVSSVALIAVVTLKLCQGIFLQSRGIFPFDFIAVIIATIAAILVLHFQVNAAWIVLGSAAVGWLSSGW